MNELEIFKNEEFGEIRALTIDNEPYLVGKDVAEALGYSNINKAIQMHVDDEDKKVLDFKGFSQNGKTSKRTSDYEEKRRSRREKLEAIRLIDQQNDGLNTVKDTVSLLKLMNKQQQELYENNPDIKTLVLCNTEMLSVVVDVLEKLSKRRYR